MALILGIDPGLQHTGWGVIKSEGSKLSFVACGTLHSKTKAPMVERLADLSQGLSDLIEQYRPQTGAIEETFVNKNAQSSLKLGHARGALILTMGQQNLPVYEYAALLVKKTVTGVGRAEKSQIKAMLKVLLPAANPDSEDAADALAVAICHAHQNQSL